MKPILFSTEMVRAILDGRKTVTRRVVMPQPVCHGPSLAFDAHSGDFFLSAEKGWLRCRICGHDPEYSREGAVTIHHWKPRYKKGDILYVRETWCQYGKLNDYDQLIEGTEEYYYRADGENPTPFNDFIVHHPGWDECRKTPIWHPSIHMPKEAARLFLRVMDVGVERLQEITEEEALAEGIPDEWPMKPVYCPHCKGEGLLGALHPVSLGFMEVDCPYCEKAVVRFSNLWNSTVPKEKLLIYGWNANPWVWIYRFERISEEEAQEGGAGNADT